jgi:hypothetical protein
VLFVRVWLQTKQEFVVYAIDSGRLVRGHGLAPTYRRVADAIADHIVR